MAPNPPQHPAGREIINLDSDSTDSDTTPTARRSPSAHFEPPNMDRRLPTPMRQDTGAEAYQKCLQAILAVFPDISHDHVQQLWNKPAWGALIESDMLHQTLIEDILDGGAYPKERDRLRELKKRKRASPEAEAAKWKYADLRHDPIEYARVARARLYERFDWVPSKFLNEAFKEHAHYYGAFFSIDEADRKRDDSTGSPFLRLKSKRTTGVRSEQVMASLEAEGHDFEGLKEEMKAAEARWQKEEDGRKAAKERRIAKEASDNEYRRKGETLECACCFSDDNPPTEMTHCNADQPHFFCFGCAKQNADIDMTSLKYALRCMDQSRCEATFSRQERARFLDVTAIDKLERLQQQDEIRRADLGDLEACPFCEYAAICAPIDVDRVFDCQNPECMEASCRLCKQKSHIPLSCEEFKKESGIEERHAIEEARTEALIRSCKKCKVRILKEDGCNKVVCTNCYSVICDYCGEDITKAKYEHFDAEYRGPPTGKGKCPLYDTSNRKEEQIEKAGKAAMEKVRKENPGLSEEDLKIKFAKSVQDQSKRHRDLPDARFHPLEGMRLFRQRLQAGPPGPVPFDPFDRMQAGLDPVFAQQQLEAMQAHQAQVRRRMQRNMQRLEAHRGDLDVEIDEGEAQYHLRRENDRDFVDLAIGGYPSPQVPLGQLANGAGNQPPAGMPMFGHPFVRIPAGNGLDPRAMGSPDAQQRRGARDFLHGELDFEPMPLRDFRQPVPRAGRPRTNIADLRQDNIVGQPNPGGYGLREQNLARLEQLENGRTAGGRVHRQNQRDEVLGVFPPPLAQSQQHPEQGLTPHYLNLQDFNDRNWMFAAGRAQGPLPQPANQEGQVQDFLNARTANLGARIQPGAPGAGAGAHLQGGAVPPPPFINQPQGAPPPPWFGHAMDAPIDLEAEPMHFPVFPNWDVDQQVPDFMGDEEFEAFMADFGNVGQGGQGPQEGQAGPVGQRVQGGQQHLERIL